MAYEQRLAIISGNDSLQVLNSYLEAGWKVEYPPPSAQVSHAEIKDALGKSAHHFRYVIPIVLQRKKRWFRFEKKLKAGWKVVK